MASNQFGFWLTAFGYLFLERVGAFLKKLEGVGYVGPVGFQGFGIRGEPREILGRTMEAWKKLRGGDGDGVRKSGPSAEGKE